MSKLELSEYLLKTSSSQHWQKIGLAKRAGISVPLFSIYSKESLGIGDFRDLKLLVDWCNQTGLSIIQLLPLNNLGATLCPYDTLSSFALEPAYLSLALLPQAKKIKRNIEDLKRKFSTARTHLDYGIRKEKINLSHQLFMEGGSVETAEFKQFKNENSYWLDSFALFMVLRQYHNGRPWYEWEEQYKTRYQEGLENFRRGRVREIEFQAWLQWQLYSQFKQVREYAQKKKVLIEGDLPILASRDSADVWVHPEFFKLDFASGAPPDMYCSKGQRWGMPPYNWEKITQDGYRYLQEKLKYAQNFYDILRVDHVAGLFRIWSIPYGEPLENQGLHGAFDPPDENKWGKQGEEMLSQMIKTTGMLLCAEDLGVIPKVCTKALEKMGIPGNDVQRWMKDWKVRHDFRKPEEYRLLSVAMLSTHDTTNWRAWWENEAGTVDEGLFTRRCQERGIDYINIKNKLFDSNLSKHNRLRWLNSVSSVEILVSILGKSKEEVLDFVDMYENTYREKEKLWKDLKLEGPMREKADSEILAAVLKITLGSRSVFCTETIFDWLGLADMLPGDPYLYRINMPGTISPKNWSLVVPISLDDLLKHRVCAEIKKLVSSSGRV